MERSRARKVYIKHLERFDSLQQLYIFFWCEQRTLKSPRVHAELSWIMGKRQVSWDRKKERLRKKERNIKAYLK